MSQTDINLKDLQDAIIGVPKDLILPENHNNGQRDLKQKSIRKIVNMYSTCRSNNRIFKSTYDALADTNPFVRVAAADLISSAGTKNSFEYLFQALEDEENVHVKQEIVKAINKLETRVYDNIYDDEPERQVSFMETMRILSKS